MKRLWHLLSKRSGVNCTMTSYHSVLARIQCHSFGTAAWLVCGGIQWNGSDSSCHFTWAVTHEQASPAVHSCFFHKVKCFWGQCSDSKVCCGSDLAPTSHILLAHIPHGMILDGWPDFIYIFASCMVIIWRCIYTFWPPHEIGFKAQTPGVLGCTVVQPSLNLT